MQGIYRNATESSFVTDEQIKAESYQQERINRYVQPELITQLPQPKGFDYWSARLQDRQRVYFETENDPNNIEIQFHDTTLIAFMSDLHVGSAKTDYARIEAECRAIVETPNCFVWMMGDVMDNFFWLPATEDDIEGITDQYKYVQAMFKYLGDNKKLLIGTSGNHDMWIKRSGLNPYVHFAEQTGAYYTAGTTYLTAKVVAQEYKICGNHQFLGRSYLNPTHSQGRAWRSEGATGSDIVVSGHYHTKGISKQTYTHFGGKSQEVHLIALGCYKPEDSWTKEKGFAVRDSNSMYGACAVLGRDGYIDTNSDILRAIERFRDGRY